MQGAKITYEKVVTPDEVVNEGITIFRKCQAKGNSDQTSDKVRDELSARIQKEHPEFCAAYPLVVQFAVYGGEFSAKALHKYVLHIRDHPWNSQDEYFEAQAKYAVLLYKETHPKYDKNAVAALRSNIVAHMKKEYTGFKDDVKKTDEELQKEEAARTARLREDIKEQYKTFAREGRKLDGSISVIPGK